jgi:SAM-dependent methyltransferase
MKIDAAVLAELNAVNRRLGLRRILKSIGYERSAELPFVINALRDRFSRPLRCLDIGTGDSVLPAYLLLNTSWDVTCLDKFRWVQVQHEYARRLALDQETMRRLHVVEEDLLAYEPDAPFDVILSISVIEHFSDGLDAKAMSHSARLLNEGGVYVLTTLVNDGFPRDFYRRGEVYGSKLGEMTFYQRHYDVASVASRLIAPSGLREVERKYFGEYGLPFGEWFIGPRLTRNPLKVFYQWLAPHFALRFLTYSDRPVSRPGMRVNTAAGVILMLVKP